MLGRNPFNMARHGHSARAFTLVEILIVVMILAILAMLIMPSFLNAQVPANENVLRENLRSMRTQIELFVGQHANLAPGYPNGNRSATPTEAAFIAQLTQYTSESGLTAASYSAATPVRPHLQGLPVNPFNKLSATLVIADDGNIPAADGETYGWFYKPRTRQFIANTPGADEHGRAYADY